MKLVIILSQYLLCLDEGNPESRSAELNSALKNIKIKAIKEQSTEWRGCSHLHCVGEEAK